MRARFEMPSRAAAGFLGVLAVVLGVTGRAAGWGLETHVLVNRLAAEQLGGSCGGFFMRHQDELSRRAAEPDTVQRARQGRAEEVRHFMDLDAYGPYPFAMIPTDRKAAVRRFGAEVVRERGTLPWAVASLFDRLRAALAAGGARQEAKAVRLAAYLGHYVADACMPFHTTENHDGQRTGQRGVHERVENDVVDRHLGQFERRLRRLGLKAASVEKVDGFLFALLRESYREVEPLLAADRRAGAGRKQRVSPVGYWHDLDRRAGPLLTRRLAAAVGAIAGLWGAACPIP